MKYFSKKYLIAALIASFAALIIFYRFPNLPQNISVDELEFARLSLSLEKKPTIYSPLATGHTTPYYFFILSSFKIFGISTFSLRLPAAVFGVLNSVLIYLLLLRFFKTVPAFLGAFIFLSLRWNFQFARFAFEATYLLFWQLLSILLLLTFIKQGRKNYWFAALLTTVVAFYSYLPGRIFFLVPITLLILRKSKLQYIVGFLLTVFLFATPLFLQTNAVEERVQNLTYLNNKKLTSKQKFNMFCENIGKNLLMFSFKGDLNGRHNYPGKPALNPILSGILLLGVFLAFKKNKANFFFFLAWFLISIAPSLLTYPQENPHFLRTYSAIVALVFFMTETLANFWQKRPIAIKLLLITLLILSSAYELRTYFYYQRQVFPQAFELKQKELLKLNFPR